MNGFDWWSLYQEGLIEFKFNDSKIKIESFKDADDLDIRTTHKTYGLPVYESNKVIMLKR